MKDQIKVERLFDILPSTRVRYSRKPDLLAGKENGEWVKYSIDDYITHADKLSYGLLDMGIKAGDRIATISNNRPEWNFLDMAILQIGAIHVPIYPTISESDYRYILSHAEIRLVLVSSRELLKKIEHLVPEIPSCLGLYTFNRIDGVPHYSDILKRGEKHPVPEALQAIKATVQPDDMATLIYTSGTTGNPKGVMLSHRNIIADFKAVEHIPPFDDSGRSLSYLPLCHIYERMLNYLLQYLGISIYYAESLATIPENLKEVKPELMTTVPRLLEKFYDKILAVGRKQKGIRKVIFFWAVNLGLRYELERQHWFYELQLKIANALVFKKWREAMGGRFQVIVSGGAALQPRLCRAFTAAGIPVIEGYGLTETSPVIAVNHFDKNGRKFGTVGPPVDINEVRIADDGEILCKGPNVMLGYYKDPVMTKECIDEDQWFHTGDIGVLEPGGYLRITGRKKEMFKTSLGKYVSPAPIENKFKESPFIDSILVIGENQKFAAALIVPNFQHLRSYCQVKGYDFSYEKEVVQMPVIRKRFQKELDKFNVHFGDTEKIRKFELMGQEWSIEGGELTASLKLRREYIIEKYQDIINRIFRNEP